MSALKDQAAPEDPSSIERRVVSEAERPLFLTTHAGSYYMQMEILAYRIASAQSNYNGGYWEFYELGNGGWYMAPQSDDVLEFRCPNGFGGKLSSDAAGVAISLIAINILLWTVYEADPALGQKLNDAFYALREYAAQHKEAAEIFGVID